MKTIEEKAKAYDEVLTKAAALYKASEPMSGCNVIIETLFPELKESEEKPNGGIVREDFTQGDGWYKVNLDYLSKAQVEEIEQLVEKWNPKEVSEEEKIKKAILIYLDWLDGKKDYLPKGDYTIKDMILWLEKQGEKKSITFNNAHIIDPALNDYCCKIYNALHKENGGVLSFARLQHLAMDIYGWCKEYLQGEQKPAAWSEEDERMFNSCCAAVAAADYYTLVDKQDIENWLQSLKGRVQPKQEWGEEDNLYYDDICEILMNLLHSERADINKTAVQKDINWLQSIKPQNRWKPSELQLGCLSDAIECYNSLGYPAPKLKELLDDLKKLKGEV